MNKNSLFVVVSTIVISAAIYFLGASWKEVAGFAAAGLSWFVIYAISHNNNE